jgi:hypothetical protein
MAARTLAEGQTRKTNRHALLLGRVTSFASDARMQTRKRKMSFRVIELSNGLPRGLCVATLALNTKLSCVLILMAGRAIRFQPEETLRRVALSTCERRMLPFEHISCLPVIKPRDIARPADQIEIAACVFGVTTRAIALALAGIDNACVKSLISIHPSLYVHVARQAFQLWPSGAERVTASTLQRALQIFMSLRQGTRRQLCGRDGRPEE